MPQSNVVNFLPDDYLKRKAARRAVNLCVGLLAITMLGIGVGFYVASTNISDLRLQNETLAQQLQVEADRIKRFDELRDKQKKLTRQVQVTSSLIENIRRSVMLAEITNALPDGVSLTSLAMDSRVRVARTAPPKQTALDKKKASKKKDEPEPPPVKVYEVTLKLNGVAYTDVQVAELITTLSKSPLLQDVNPLVSETTMYQDEVMRKFEIEAKLRPDATTSDALQLMDEIEAASASLQEVSQ